MRHPGHDLLDAWGHTIVPTERVAALTVQVPVLTMTGFLNPYWAKVGEFAARAVGMVAVGAAMDPGVYSADLHKGSGHGAPELILTMGLNHQTGRMLVRVDGSDPAVTAEYPLMKVMDKPIRNVAQMVSNLIRKAMGMVPEPEEDM